MNDVFAANKLVRDAGEVTNSYIYIKSWIGKYGYMYRDIQMIRAIMYLAMVLVIGVACFNIVSTLVMAVKDKSADIAVLRTLGAKDGFIRAIFIWYGLLAGLLGSLSGVVIGVTASLQLTNIIRGIETGRPLLPVGRYLLHRLPAFRAALAGRADRAGNRHRAEPVGQLVSGQASQPHRSGAGAERTIKPTGRQRCRPFFWGWVMYYGFDMGGTKIELGCSTTTCNAFGKSGCRRRVKITGSCWPRCAI